MIQDVLEKLGVLKSSIRAYMRLLEHGPASARRLAENLGVPRPSVYDNLKQLIQMGLVVEREEESKKIFQVDDPKNLPRLLRGKIQELEQGEREITKFLSTLAKQTKDIEPRIKFYPGTTGVQRILHDILWYDNIEVLTMWPFREMAEVLGSDHLTNFNRERIRKHISIRAIWPRDKVIAFKEYPFIGVGKEHLRELRLAPVKTTWDMGHAVYEDKVSFISSRKESFGFIVHSHDFAELMRTQFEVMWSVSRPVKAESQWSKKFLETV